MNCKELKEFLSAYADNELANGQIILVEEHLAACIDCRAVLADYRVAGERLLGLQAVTAGMPDSKEYTMRAIQSINVKKQPVRWLRPAFIGVPVMVIMIVLAVLQPWTPAGGNSTSVMAMEQLIARVETTNSFDSIKSCRVVTYDSAKIDADGNIQSFGNVYEAEFTLIDFHLKVLSPQDEVTSEFIFLYGGGIKYYRDDNETSMDYQAAVLKAGGGISTRDRTLVILKNNTNVLQSADEAIDGVVCLHYHGVSNPDMELWVGKDDCIIRQVATKSPEQKNTEYITLRKYYDFNAPVTVQAPEDASGNLLSGWQTTGNAQPITVTVQGVTLILQPKPGELYSRDGTASKVIQYFQLSFSQEWILANDKCANPYFAMVTFPTRWITDEQGSGMMGGVFFTEWAADPSETLSHFKTVPSDIDSYIEDAIVYSDTGELTGVKVVDFLMLTIGDEETTAFFNFTDPGAAPLKMLNKDGLALEQRQP